MSQPGLNLRRDSWRMLHALRQARGAVATGDEPLAALRRSAGVCGASEAATFNVLADAVCGHGSSLSERMSAMRVLGRMKREIALGYIDHAIDIASAVAVGSGGIGAVAQS